PLTLPPLLFPTAPPPPHLYTLSLHDALPISVLDDPSALRAPHRPPSIPPPDLDAICPVRRLDRRDDDDRQVQLLRLGVQLRQVADRKSTRLNSSHQIISYAVFCLKKKNNLQT